MRKLASTTAVALALGLGGTAAWADEELFNQLDADSDGEITKEEFVGHSEKMYKDAQAQPDDALFTRDYTERRIHRDDEPVDTVNFDTDQDDRVSMEEAQADWDASFSSLDENGDGVIDDQEWEMIGK